MQREYLFYKYCGFLHVLQGNLCSGIGALLPLPSPPTLMSSELFLSYLSLFLQLLCSIFWENMFSQRHLVWEAQLWLMVNLLELAVSNREAQVSSHADTYLQHAGS